MLARSAIRAADSMAWSLGGRKWGPKTDGSEHDPRKALAYCAQVESLIAQPSYRVTERLDEPRVACPFLRKYSVDVAGESGRSRAGGLLRCGFVVHKHHPVMRVVC